MENKNHFPERQRSNESLFFQENLPNKPQRVAIFAAYNPQGIVPDYVVYYLTGLREVVDAIIYISDNTVYKEEVLKIRDLVVYASFMRHGRYDFGSYKDGFLWAEQHGLLTHAEELLFVNDSCYGPVFPLEQVFSTMDRQSCDFWGMVESQEITHHIQSYFIVFRRSVFITEAFRSFLTSFEKQDTQWDYVLKYETTLTHFLQETGFSYTSIIKANEISDTRNAIYNPTFYPLSLLKAGVPLIKRKVTGYAFDNNLQESFRQLLTEIRKQNGKLYEIIVDDLCLQFTIEKSSFLSEWAQVLSELSSPTNAINALTSKLADLYTGNEALSGQIQQARTRVASLEKELAQSTKEKETLNESLSNLRVSLSMQEERYSRKENDYNKLSEALEIAHLKTAKHLRAIRLLIWATCSLLIIVFSLILFY